MGQGPIYRRVFKSHSTADDHVLPESILRQESLHPQVLEPTGLKKASIKVAFLYDKYFAPSLATPKLPTEALGPRLGTNFNLIDGMLGYVIFINIRCHSGSFGLGI